MLQTIQIGRLVNTRAVTADSLRRMIIGHDENDIGLPAHTAHTAHTAHLLCGFSAISMFSEDGLVRVQDIIQKHQYSRDNRNSFEKNIT